MTARRRHPSTKREGPALAPPDPEAAELPRRSLQQFVRSFGILAANATPCGTPLSHHTADSIAAAARQGDRVAVTRALGSTLQTCTSCHAAYRQSVVDEEAWSRATSTSPPTEHGQ